MKERSLYVAWSYEYMETDNINFVKSSLKSHPLWVTLYIKDINPKKGEGSPVASFSSFLKMSRAENFRMRYP